MGRERRYTEDDHRRAVDRIRELIADERSAVDLAIDLDGRVLEAIAPENTGTARERRATVAARLGLASTLRRSIARRAALTDGTIRGPEELTAFLGGNRAQRRAAARARKRQEQLRRRS